MSESLAYVSHSGYITPSKRHSSRSTTVQKEPRRLSCSPCSQQGRQGPRGPQEIQGPKGNDVNASSSPDYVYLSQKDFKNGSYTIKKPGWYKLSEDIVFDYNPEEESKHSFTRQLRCFQKAYKIMRKATNSIYFCERSISSIPAENESSLASHLVIHEFVSDPKNDLLSQSHLPNRQSQFRFLKLSSGRVQLVKLRAEANGTTPHLHNGKFTFDRIQNDVYDLSESNNRGFALYDRNNSFCKINPQYIGGATIRNGTAAIKIACHNVTVDLNQHSIQQSKQNYIEQRVFSCIQVNRLQFTNSGREFEPGPNVEQPGVSNVTIRNGKLGRSSHFGIHGTNPNLIICEDLEITNFDVSGIWLNNATQPIIRRCVINGPVGHSSPVTELRAFKTVGTGVSSIVDSNAMNIFLNDAGGQVQRMFSPDSNRILDTRPPFDGVEGSKGENRTLVGPRGGIIEDCHLGQLVSRQIQAHVVARTDQRGIVVPILFSIDQQAHSGMTACPRMIRAAMEDGMDYVNEFNPNYMELKDWVRITSNVSFRLDATGKRTEEPGPDLSGYVLIKALKVFREVSGQNAMIGGQQTICVDQYEVDKSGSLIIKALAYAADTPVEDRIRNLVVPSDHFSCHAEETVEDTFSALGTGRDAVHQVKGTYLATPRWKLQFDDTDDTHPFRSPDGTLNQSTVVTDENQCAVFTEITRRISDTDLVHPRKVEHKYKLASRCIEKDLAKAPDGSFPSLYFPNTNECDHDDQLASTGFRHFFESEVDVEQLTFVQVTDNFGIDDLDFYQGPSGRHPDRHGKGRPPITDHGAASTEANTDGHPYKLQEGDYFVVRQGSCHHPVSRLRKLSCKSATTIPLINEMLQGRCAEEECGGIRTDGGNSIDAAGHNLIGAFGLLLERAWGLDVRNININGVMVVRGGPDWAENWWGVMANNSAFNNFQNFRITNLQGNPGTVFGFHLSNGSFSNDIENVVLEGCTSTGESYGIIVDRGSENNVFKNCRVSGIIAREFAAAYLLRSSYNELHHCVADTVALEVSNGAELGGDLIAAGFILGIEDEHFSLHPRGNKCVECSAHNIRVFHENETMLERERGTWAPYPDLRSSRDEHEEDVATPTPNKTYLSGLLTGYRKHNQNVDGHTRSLLTDAVEGRLISTANAYWPNLALLSKGSTSKLPNSLAAFATLAAGFAIVHQTECTIDKCQVTNVSGWGTSAGIVVTDKFFPDEYPVSNTNHWIGNCQVKHITSFHPPSVERVQQTADGEVQVRVTEVRSGRRTGNLVEEVKELLNPSFNSEETLSDEFIAALSEHSDPHVIGIGHVTLNRKNYFHPFFKQRLVENFTLEQILPLFCADTTCIGNEVSNAQNYWTGETNSYEFYLCNSDNLGNFLNLTGEDLLVDASDPVVSFNAVNTTIAELMHPTTGLRKIKNDGLLWTGDLHTLSLSSAVSEQFPPFLINHLNYAFTNSLPRSADKIVMTKAMRKRAWMVASVFAAFRTQQTAISGEWIECAPAIDTHAKVEQADALLLPVPELAEHSDSDDDDCFDHEQLKILKLNFAVPPGQEFDVERERAILEQDLAQHQQELDEAKQEIANAINDLDRARAEGLVNALQLEIDALGQALDVLPEVPPDPQPTVNFFVPRGTNTVLSSIPLLPVDSNNNNRFAPQFYTRP